MIITQDNLLNLGFVPQEEEDWFQTNEGYSHLFYPSEKSKHMFRVYTRFGKSTTYFYIRDILSDGEDRFRGNLNDIEDLKYILKILYPSFVI